MCSLTPKQKLIMLCECRVQQIIAEQPPALPASPGHAVQAPARTELANADLPFLLARAQPDGLAPTIQHAELEDTRCAV